MAHPNPPAVSDRIFGLDLMRASAIVMVLLAHGLWLFPESDRPIIQLLNLMGFFGVEMFFVLSGFLIGKILMRVFFQSDYGGKQVLHFLKRRWLRTLPSYYLILLVNIGIAAFIGYRIDGVWRYFFFLQNFAWPLMPFFPESWSLSVEETAYLVLPLSLLLISRLPSERKSGGFLGLILLLLGVGIAAKCGYHLHHGATSMAVWNLSLRSVVVFRIDAIFTGVLFGWVAVNYPRAWHFFRIPAAAVATVAVLFFVVGPGGLGLLIDRYPFFWNVIYLPLVSFSFAMFLPFLSQWKQGPGLIGRTVTFVAIISYAMYLLHYSVVLQLLKHYVAPATPIPMLLVFAGVYLMVTVVLSYLLYRYYEKPMTDLRDSS